MSFRSLRSDISAWARYFINNGKIEQYFSMNAFKTDSKIAQSFIPSFMCSDSVKLHLKQANLNLGYFWPAGKTLKLLLKTRKWNPN